MPSRDFVQTNCLGLLPENRGVFNFGSHVRLSHLIFSAMSLTLKKEKKLHSVNAEQIKGNVPLTLPHWGLETVKISAQLLRTDLPRKIIFFWTDVVFCHGVYILTGILLLLAWALQNSQQAISVPDSPVARQEILVMLRSHNFHSEYDWRYLSVFFF